MTVLRETLLAGLSGLASDIDLSAAQLALLEQHWQLLQQANSQFNLTAIRQEAEAATKHYLDCLLPLPLLRQLAADLGRPPQVADLGSGAGFPGLVLAIACPESRWLLLEANGKKSRFLAQCADELGLDNVSVLAERAETIGRDLRYREQLDLVTARALAPLPVLLEYALPLLQVDGSLLALKGPGLAQEEQAATQALKLLQAAPAGQSLYRLPGGETRILACYRKHGPTPANYPRRPGMPEKRPL